MSTRPGYRSGRGGLSYHDSAYWDTRFSSDPREAHGFEWLSSSTSLFSLIPPSLLLRNPPIRILHIGVGTSHLSLDLVRYWKQHSPADWKERAKQVVNVDFSEKSIQFQQHAQSLFLNESQTQVDERGLMQYHVLDLLDWEQVQKTLGEERFDLVLDKSTTDSISTGSDVPLSSILTSQTHTEKTHHSDLIHLAKIASKEPGIATIQLLGIHLGALVNKGALWLCHSYSSDRWEDVISSEDQGEMIGWPWEVADKTPVPVQSSHPNAPQINHYIYTMHRL